jgi:dethiobiotin synthetase
VLKKRFFVTGTDTDAGKTFVASHILSTASRRKLACFGLKPVAAGADFDDNGIIRNSDAMALMASSSLSLKYEQVNPILLEPAIAPHIAAAQAHKVLTVQRLQGYIQGALLTPADLVLVEGAGGWKVPLNAHEDLSMLAQALNMPVILVVNMKLGCINHALLTYESILRDGLTLAGWVANSPQTKMPMYEENLVTLQQRIGAPLLAQVHASDSPELSTQAFEQLLDQLLLL